MSFEWNLSTPREYVNKLSAFLDISSIFLCQILVGKSHCDKQLTPNSHYSHSINRCPPNDTKATRCCISPTNYVAWSGKFTTNVQFIRNRPACFQKDSMWSGSRTSSYCADFKMSCDSYSTKRMLSNKASKHENMPNAHCSIKLESKSQRTVFRWDRNRRTRLWRGKCKV